jgi:hypothetical protein
MRAAASAASPQEHRREQARGATGNIVRGAGGGDRSGAAYDLSLLVGVA